MTPAEVLHDPAPAQVRAAIRARAADTDADDPAGVGTHDLELAVTEIVANASEHGLPPIEVALRTVGGRLEVTVRDGGPGPSGPVPSPPVGREAVRGRGRWLAHQVAEVRERSTAHGYEVRLTTSASPRPHGSTGAHD